jgi:dolichyl-phosphate-mannose-protein mannosyltransferase
MPGLGRLSQLDVAGSIPVSPSKPCRLLLIASGLALLWGWSISISGGFIVRIGQLRISSHNSNHPFVLALLALVAVWIVAPRGCRWQTAVGEFSALARAFEKRLPRLTPPETRALVTGTAGLIAVTVVLLGVFRGAFVAGGPDSYGYVSQARLWRDGIPRVELPQVGVLPDGIPLEALVPLGYRLGTDRTSLVPAYSPGYPMLMALIDGVGPAGSMFLVMPILAGIAVWATYVLGSITAGRIAGMIAALILATSPAFDLQLTHGPMSDIPAMALWTVTLVLLPRSSRHSAFVAGLVAGAAILVRPNLVPLALVPGALLVWNVAARRPAQSLATQRLLLFGIAAAPACLVIAYLNDKWYGSPLASGYGSLAEGLYSWNYFWPNAADYTRRTVDSQGPLVVAGLAAPMLLWRNQADEQRHPLARSILVTYAAFAIAVYLCYAFYVPLDTWWTLRFLFPAFPVAFVFVSAVLLTMPKWLPPHARWLAVVVLVGTAAAHAIGFGRANYSFDSTKEWRYATAGRYVAEKLPERAVFFTMLHSGSARYYSGRLTVRYDLIPPQLFERAIAYFQGQGYAPFLLLDDDERGHFVERFTGATSLAALDWPPVATLDGVAIYDVAAK